MISEREFKNYEDVFCFVEPNTIEKGIIDERIYEIIEQKCMSDIFPINDLQDEKLTQDILETYIILCWGLGALVSTILWLLFFINRISNIRFFKLS